MYCIVLCSLYCIVLYCIVLYCIVLYCVHCIVLVRMSSAQWAAMNGGPDIDLTCNTRAVYSTFTCGVQVKGEQ